MSRARFSRALAASSLMAGLVVGLSVPVAADSGGINHVDVGSLRCFVRMTDGTTPVFEASACGTYVAVDGVTFAPPQVTSGTNDNVPNGPAYVIESDTQSGSGTTSDPVVVTTKARIGSTGIRLTERDAYVVGGNQLTTTVRLFGDPKSDSDSDEDGESSNAPSAVVYRALRCFDGFDRAAVPSEGTDSARCTSVQTGATIDLAGDGSPKADDGTAVVRNIVAGSVVANGCRCAKLTDPALVASRQLTLEDDESQTFQSTITFAGDFSLPPPAPEPASNGNMSCSASSITLDFTAGPLAAFGVISPIVANFANDPCASETGTLLDLPLPTGSGDHVTLLRAETTDQRGCDTIGSVHDPTIETGAASSSGVLDLQVGGATLQAKVLSSHAEQSQGIDQSTPTRSGDSDVASVTLFGSPVPIPIDKTTRDAPTLDLSPLATLWLREEIATPDSLTERALELDTPLVNVIVAESKVDGAGARGFGPCEPQHSGGARYL